VNKTTAILSLLLFLLVPSLANAAPNKPVYTTLEQVQQLIADAIAPLQSAISGLDTRLTALEATPAPTPTSALTASPTPQPSPISKDIKVLDANGQELGIFVSGNFGKNATVFLPSTNQVIEIGPNGIIRQSSLYYKELNCQGTTYHNAGLNDFSYNKVYTLESGEYWKIEAPTVPTEGNSFVSRWYFETSGPNPGFRCENAVFTGAVAAPLVETTLPIADPIALPLQYRYQ
jgi:hypothetical protein